MLKGKQVLDRDSIYNRKLEVKGDKKASFMNYLARIGNALQCKQKDFIPDGIAGLKKNCVKKPLCALNHITDGRNEQEF